MTFVLLALVTHQRHVDRLELRAGGAQLSSVVFQDPNPISDHDPPFKTLYLNGRATTITVPSDYEVKVIGRNRAGQVIAEVGLDTVQGEPMLWDSFHGFWMTTARGKAEVLPQGGDMIDDRGRVFSCPMNEQPMMPIDSPHLFMWQNGKTRDLGPAYGWR